MKAVQKAHPRSKQKVQKAKQAPSASKTSKSVSKSQAKPSKAAASKEVPQAPVQVHPQASTQIHAKADVKLKNSKITETKASSSLAPAKALPKESAMLSRGGSRVCRESPCENEPTAGGDYCRMHYIRNWRKIKRKEVILKEKKLNQYIEELVSKYPEKYIEAVKMDLSFDKDFNKVVHELELNVGVDDEDGESETIDSLLDNIRKDIEVSGAAPPDDDEDLY